MSNIKIKKIVYVKDAKLFELDIDDVILNLPIGSDSQFGKIKLSDAIDSVSSALDGVASTPKAVKTVSDNLTNLTSKVNEVKTTSDLALETTNSNTLKIDDINSILEKGKVEFVTVLPEVTEENVLYVLPDDSEGFLEDDIYATKEEIANFVTKDEIPTVFGNGKVEFVDSVPAEEDSNTLYVLPSDEDAIIDDSVYASKTEVGDLSNLETSSKDSIVTAINEVRRMNGPGSSGLDVGDIGQAIFPIDENQLKRRYLNGQLISIEQYQDFFTKLKNVIKTYPSLSCTETEWQEIIKKSAVGQCGKFVIDEKAGMIRLPKIIMPLQGLIDLSSLGEIVDAGLPNVTGSVGQYYSVSGAFHNQNDTGVADSTSALYLKGTDAGNTCTWSNYGDGGLITLDLSRNNSIYGNSETVQPEAIQYPYFIQVATGVSEVIPAEKELTLNNPYSLLEHKIVDCKLNNTSWLRSEGQFNSGDVYSDAYNLLLSELSNKTRDFSIKTTDEPYTDYDFILNTTDKTFRLPLFTTERQLVEKKEPTEEDPSWYNLYSDGWLEQGGRSDEIPINSSVTITFLKSFIDSNYYANWISCSGTNASGQGTRSADNLTTTSMRLYNGQEVAMIANWSAQGYTSKKPASASNLYYYVGDTVQNASLINAGRIEEKIIDISTNLIPDNTENIINYCLPDYSAGIILGDISANTEYEAPAKGEFIFNTVTSTPLCIVYINGFEVYKYQGGSATDCSGTMAFKLEKGDIIKQTGNKMRYCYFFPFKGVNQNA